MILTAVICRIDYPNINKNPINQKRILATQPWIPRSIPYESEQEETSRAQ